MARVPRGRGGRAGSRGGRAVARGGRVVGCGGRSRGRGGRGRVAKSFEWETQSESSDQVVVSPAYQELSEGSVSVSDGSAGARVSARVSGAARGPGAGGVSGGAQDLEDHVSKMLALILERLPGAAPVQTSVEARREQYLAWSNELLLMGPLSFSGRGRPEEANEWRLKVERRLRILRCPDEFCVDLAVEFLEGDASLWWTGVQARRRRTLWTWGDFLGEFNARYFPQEVVEQLELQFQSLVQGNRSVRGYDAEFSRLVVYASSGMDEERAQMGKFVAGLRIELKKPGMVSRYASRAELVEALVAVEGLEEQFED